MTKLTILGVDSSAAVNTSVICNHHLYPVLKCFHRSKKKPQIHEATTPPSPSPHDLAILILKISLSLNATALLKNYRSLLKVQN